MSVHRLSSGLPLLGVLTACACLAGCATVSTPRYDARFGDAVRAARQSQLLYVQPSGVRDPVLGMDGVSGVTAITHYQCPDASKPSPTVSINLGSSGQK